MRTPLLVLICLDPTFTLHPPLSDPQRPHADPPHTHCRHAGAALVSLLEAHPSLLTYSVSSDGKQLEKGPAARASVDVVDRQGGGKAAGVSYWRVGASFASAPVAPYKPSAM